MDEQRLEYLLNRYLDEALSPEEKAELEQMLLRSPRAREQFWQQAGFHALLREYGEQSWAGALSLHLVGRAGEGGDECPETGWGAGLPSVSPCLCPADEEYGGATSRTSPSSGVRRWRARPAWWMLSGAVLGLLLSLAIWYSRPQETKQDRVPEEVQAVAAAEPTTDSIAILTRAVAAQWDEDGSPIKVGAPLSAGTIKLASGLAQVEFHAGATVILEGPTELRLVSAAEAYLVRGKLRAEVPPPATGFLVRCPAADVVDLGTEFGVSIGPADDAEVHVFGGKVRLYDPGRAAAGDSRFELTTGCGLRIDAGGDVIDIPADPDVFHDPLALLKRSESLQAARQHEWLEHQRSVARDPRLLRYFAFDSAEPWSRRIANAAARTAPDGDAAIVGCRWTQGRWLGKEALEFAGISDRVRFHAPGEFAALTLVASLRVDALENRYNSIMMCDDFETGELHWQIARTGEVALGIQGPDDSHGVTYRTPRVFTPERFGQWVQLAVVVDPAAGVVTHYLDGAEIAREPWQQTVRLRIGAAQLGNWGVYRHATPTPIRSLTGRIDEFMLFAAALPPEEINRLARFTQPAP